MRDLIFVSLENWDEVWRRNQFLCAGLARRLPRMKILFVGLPRNVSHQVRSGKIDRDGPATRALPDYPNIIVTRPLKLLPNTITLGRKFNERLARSHIRRAARAAGLSRPLLWLNPHDAVHMTGKMGERAVVYDITDDWALAEETERGRRLVEMQDRALCQRADLTIVCSQALADSRRPLCRRLLLLPNGVDAEHYRIARQTPDERKYSAPVFGYTGTLHPSRTDVGLICAVAKAFPQGNVVLIGPDHLDDASHRLLKEQPNVCIAGQVPYARIGQEMAQFDVCIVPHVESGFTESLNPIKLWEYLACGKPIVSSNVAGFRDYARFCRIATGPEEFVQACSEALEEARNSDGQKVALRVEEALKHSWDARLELLLEALQPFNK